MPRQPRKRVCSPADFGRQVRELRLRRQLTQTALGKRAGLSYKFVGEIERGTGNPTLTTMGSLAAALGCDLADLVAIHDQRARVLPLADTARVEDAVRVLQSVFPGRRRPSERRRPSAS